MVPIEQADHLLDEQGKVLRNNFPFQLEVAELLDSLHLPIADSALEELIKATLKIDRALTDRDLSWSVLSALFSPLGQNIGSCFASAPAILIHQEQPLQCAHDLKEILKSGILSRTFGGKTYTVPASLVPKNLDSHLLLKTWEYTLASFVDVKSEFSSWNLYSSLGLDAKEESGIGQLVYQSLDEKLQEANKQVDEYHKEYENAFDQARSSESMLRGATKESDIRRLKAEYQAKVYHLEACEEMRNKFAYSARQIADFFPLFINFVIEQFQLHFQEVFDPLMQTHSQGRYDDAPAGFRLLYKYGRTHVRSWTFIEHAEDYIQALTQFFNAIESPLMEAVDWKGSKKLIGQLLTEIVHFVRADKFLDSALKRMAKTHTRSQVAPKPWAYVSGGTLDTLLQTYFCREIPFTKEARWVDSPQDLLIFLIETLKQLPPRITDLFRKNPEKRMLIASPTHVFSLLPGQSTFREGWEDPGFTYTWVRDEIIHQKRSFLFADSNWEGIFFSFVVCPQSNELQFWRTDKKLQEGEPMDEWDCYLSTSTRQPWTIYVDPNQYTFY